jgi:hypothetical protein
MYENGLPFIMLLLKGQDGQTWKDHVCNCALRHLQHVDDQIDPFLVIIRIGLCYMLCGQSTMVVMMLNCD